MAICRVTVLSLIVFLAATPSYSSEFSLGAGGGVGYMPMTEWEEFTTSGPNSHYSADDVALYLDVLARIRLGGKHGLRVSYGRISKSADWAVVSQFVPGPGSSTSVVEYKFSTAPFGFAYEYFFSGFENGSTTFAGLGASVYFTSLEAKARDLGISAFPNPPERSERVGRGLGVEIFIGQRARVSDRLSIDVQIRGRWADGLLFSDDAGDIKVEFSGVDVFVFGEWFFG